MDDANLATSVLLLVAIVCALCAVISATVCVMIWRKARSGDLGKQIADGDARVRAHAEQLLGDIRDDVNGVRDSIARIECHAAAEDKHLLRARDLTPLHERVNRVAETLAETRAQSSAEYRALGEQMRVLQGLMQNMLSSTTRNSR